MTVVEAAMVRCFERVNHESRGDKSLVCSSCAYDLSLLLISASSATYTFNVHSSTN